MQDAIPTLVYDGACGICRYWIDYWRALTGGRVRFRPYQEAAADFPAVGQEAFAHAIQLIEPDDRVYAGAAASFRVLRHAPGRGAWWWLYSHILGFALASECAYAWLARHRGVLARVSRLLWGPALEPERYALVSAIFLRLLGVIYLAAFASLAVQIEGLVGHDGILPLTEYLAAAQRELGAAAWLKLPTLFWFGATDATLLAGTIAGIVLALLVILGWWTRAALVGLFALYLSYVYAGQDFMTFQWDLLLLEAGFLAIFLTGGSRIVVWLFRWMVLRYVFLAGVVKLLSGDPTWRNLTALEYHFWTQPLPTPLAWYAAQLPHWALIGGTAAALAIEVGIVFLVVLPRRLRAFAGVCILMLQLLILLTGNYNFFNLLTMSLCVFLFDDAALSRVVPRRLAARVRTRAKDAGRAATAIAAAVALIVVPVGVDEVWQTVAGRDLPLLGGIARAVAPLMIVNRYGLFAVMTTRRPEIVIEGSNDGKDWHEYTFRYQPGAVDRAPRWNIPHQPRLDWQMWFAALGDSRASVWFPRLVERLLEASPPVLALLDANPFPGGAPKYVRALLYDYRFADPRLHAATGQWWVRNLEGLYFPPVSLADFVRLNGAYSVTMPRRVRSMAARRGLRP